MTGHFEVRDRLDFAAVLADQRGGADKRVPDATPPTPRHRGTPYRDAAMTSRRMVPTSGTSDGTLRRLDVADMLGREPEPVEWLAEGIVARGTLSLLAGREKEGKSLLLIALAACMAGGGGEIAGIGVKAGRVLIIDAENGEREVHRRLRSLGLAAEHATRFEVYEPHAHDLRHHLADLDAVLADKAPDLVVLDSWRSLWGGDENDAGEVSRCLDPLRNLIRQHTCGAILIHHLSRAGAYRGSTAIGASVESVLSLERLPDDDDRRRRRLRNPACRYEQEADDRWLRLDADRTRGLLVIGGAEPFSPAARPRRDARELLLAALTSQPVAWAVWAKAAGFDSKNGTARRARDELAQEGHAVKGEGGRWTASEPSEHDA